MSSKDRSDNSQFLSESVNDRDCGPKQLLNAWNNKLTFPFSKLGERYLRKDLGLMLHCSLDGGDVLNRKRFALSILHNFLDGSGSSGRKCEVRTSTNDDQLAMLIESVHIVNDAEGIVQRVGPELVRLIVGDKLSHASFVHSLYLSFKTGQFVFVGDFAEDGKSERVFVQHFGRVVRENPNDVIQGRSQVVDDFSNQHAEPLRDDEVSMIVNRFLPSLVICIGENWIFAAPKESEDFGVKVDDVLVGPF